jgi:hypothetical protein
MIPPNDSHKQVPGPDLPRTFAANDDALVPPARCPCCHRPWFDPRASDLLDMLHLAQDVLADIQRCVEEETLP